MVTKVVGVLFILGLLFGCGSRALEVDYKGDKLKYQSDTSKCGENKECEKE